jgi:hypothetical protein
VLISFKVCLRPPYSYAARGDSLRLGRIDEIQFWPFIKNLKIVVELRQHRSTDIPKYLRRIEPFISAIQFGAGLKKLTIMLQLEEDACGVPGHLRQVVRVLGQLRVNDGEVRIGFDEEVDDASMDVIERLERAIQQ